MGIGDRALINSKLEEYNSIFHPFHALQAMVIVVIEEPSDIFTLGKANDEEKNRQLYGRIFEYC